MVVLNQKHGHARVKLETHFDFKFRFCRTSVELLLGVTLFFLPYVFINFLYFCVYHYAFAYSIVKY